MIIMLERLEDRPFFLCYKKEITLDETVHHADRQGLFLFILII